MKEIKYTFIIATITLGCSRTNYKEKRISNNSIPQSVTNYIHQEYPKSKHVKYYLEENNDTAFYEAELQHEKAEISLRFYTNGKLFEIEKEIDFESIPLLSRKNIEKELLLRFVKYRIQKTEFVNPHLITQYELFVEGKTKNDEKTYEFHFNEQGELLTFKEILIKPIQTLF